MTFVKRMNAVVRSTLILMGVIFMGMSSLEAAPSTARGADPVTHNARIDPFKFCLNSCNERCNADDPLAPKLKAQCKKMCTDDIINKVSITQMSKNSKFKDAFNKSRNSQEKDNMIKANAPIYKCFAELTAAEESPAAPAATLAPVNAKTSIDFCVNKCNNTCLSNIDLKTQCESICSDQKDQIASLQMSKMRGEIGQKFRTSRNPEEKAQMMAENAPINKCFMENAVPVEVAPVANEPGEAQVSNGDNSAVKEQLMAKLTEMSELVNQM